MPPAAHHHRDLEGDSRVGGDEESKKKETRGKRAEQKESRGSGKLFFDYIMHARKSERVRLNWERERERSLIRFSFRPRARSLTRIYISTQSHRKIASGE